VSTLPSPRPSARRLSAPLAAALLASLCVVSAAASASPVSRHHVSVADGGVTMKVLPSRKEY
jgi:hypothetical protein